MNTPSQMPRDPSPTAVVAWEGAAASVERQLLAIAALGESLSEVTTAIMVPVALLSSATAQVTELMQRYDWRVLPLFDLRAAGPPAHRNAEALAAALAALAAAQRLYVRDDVRYAVAIIDDDRPDAAAIAAARVALAPNGACASIGWVRRTSAYALRPPGLDYVLDAPPYGEAPVTGDGVSRYPYSLLAGDLARRFAGDDLVVPSVLWSPGRETGLADSAWRITEISPLKVAYAVDTARRFVGNRAAIGAPFWLLRAAFDPDRAVDVGALDDVAQLLAAPHTPSALAAGVTGQMSIQPTGARIAVVIHIYYPDLWDEMADAIAQIPERFDLFVSCPFRVASAMRMRVRARFPGASVVGVQNLGRDVLPFLLWLRTVGANAYTYVLKLHGKKSVHILDAAQAPFASGEIWRRAALECLVGGREHVSAIVRALDDYPVVGLVAPEGQLYDQVVWKCGTSDLVATVLARLDAPRTVNGNFAAGTMFWARLAALAPLAQLPDAALDFEREAGQVDGTLHHAYERLLALVANQSGFRTTDTRALLSGTALS